MANTITTQTLNDGNKNTIIKVYLASDGVTGDESDTVVFDASAVVPAVTDCTILGIEGYLIGFTALLEFDATTDVPALILPADDQFCFDLDSRYGGIPNNAGAGKTGDITITTTGFSAATDIGWFILRVKKD